MGFTTLTDDVQVHVPEGLTALDLDLIKLTAQFVARNGKSFLTGLASREQQNPTFSFLKPTHSMFTFFTRLCDAYSSVLMPDKKIKARIAQDSDDRWAPLCPCCCSTCAKCLALSTPLRWSQRPCSCAAPPALPLAQQQLSRAAHMCAAAARGHGRGKPRVEGRFWVARKVGPPLALQPAFGAELHDRCCAVGT